ncbi:sugar phosphate isomerase/epimerase family protein [Arthrobacter globiformis]|uniref:sugar phosphate isomerase/epimerase family protein n=1 Tax=Arthrobacter globiformis TaxID=1665 RepID=UPI0027944869|nr:TIM barrel protein [Arthrobacter globiformis]MDQ0616745.1 sugar phosphate isomerase/epimerase [Arthrobacter globiformis]
MTGNAQRPLGLAQLSLLNTAPPDLVAVAAQAGFDFIGVRVRPVTPAERPYDLHPGSPMLRKTLSRMQDTGVTVRDIEFLLLDGSDQREAWLRMMEAGQALGASSLTVAGADPDSTRLVGTLARMTEDGRGFGITPTLEAISYQPVASIAQAADIARQAGCRIVVDTLHFNRYNGPGAAAQWEELRANADLVPLLQLCDGPAARPATREELVTESRSEREVPGEGKFSLAAAVAALPASLPVSAEAPSDRRVAELGELGWARLLKSGVDAVLAQASSLQLTGTLDTAGAK